MSEASRGVHLATLAHEGRIWDAYLEFDDEPSLRDYRARVRFSSPEADRFYRTTVIIIEPSYEEAVHHARALEERQLQALLRSVLPEDEEE
jgi:hypothetical protein